MAEKFASKRNIKFMIYEVFNTAELTQHEFFRDHNPETYDMIIDTIWKMADGLMYPLLQEMDANPPQYIDGQAKVHPVVREYMRQCGEGGWINASWSYDNGGQQLPALVDFVMSFIMSAANSAMSIFLGLTSGAMNLILNFGSPELKDRYLKKMAAGEWQGTMALTEPDAGSSLSDIKTVAEDTGGLGYYHIRGKKIFISAGDTSATDNTVHLMLAKIKGAPAGVKGISLFVVPKYRFTADGHLEFNDVSLDGIEHKMGVKGCPACQLSMGDNNDCRGYLVGEPGMGLAYMFRMMNEARIGTGIIAAAKTTACYYACLEYAGQRLQGRKPGQKDPASPQVLIIEHGDIRRMLLFQRAVAEGSLSLALQLSKYLDLSKAGVETEKHELLVDFLVPIVKTFPSEYGILSTSAAMQCLGGYGYCRDFPVEQYFRDIRIDAILEGSTGIQGIDLLGRKVTMKKSQAFKLFVSEVKKTVTKATMIPEISQQADELARGLGMMDDVTAYLLEVAGRNNEEEFLADATLYMEMVGIVAIGWQWLLQGITAHNALQDAASGSDKNFYDGKLHTLRYFMTYELSKVDGLARTLKNSRGLTAYMSTSVFGGE
jgi:alkylation response protein AidB-like acyl-CoA dehydrogenase